MVILWQEVMATGERGWEWIQRTDTYSKSGSNKDGRVIYEDLKILMLTDDVISTSRSKGTIVTQYFECFVPKFELTDDEIVPIINRTFFRKNGITYKVIGIHDLTNDPEFFCYRLTLRRDSLY